MIQESSHNPATDARASIELVLLKLRNGIEFGDCIVNGCTNVFSSSSSTIADEGDFHVKVDLEAMASSMSDPFAISKFIYHTGLNIKQNFFNILRDNKHTSISIVIRLRLDYVANLSINSRYMLVLLLSQMFSLTRNALRVAADYQSRATWCTPIATSAHSSRPKSRSTSTSSRGLNSTWATAHTQTKRRWSSWRPKRLVRSTCASSSVYSSTCVDCTHSWTTTRCSCWCWRDARAVSALGCAIRPICADDASSRTSAASWMRSRRRWPSCTRASSRQHQQQQQMSRNNNNNNNKQRS